MCKAGIAWLCARGGQEHSGCPVCTACALHPQLSLEIHAQLADAHPQLSLEIHAQLANAHPQLSLEIHAQLADAHPQLSLKSGGSWMG